jgi:hypothetical protein
MEIYDWLTEDQRQDSVMGQNVIDFYMLQAPGSSSKETGRRWSCLSQISIKPGMNDLRQLIKEKFTHTFATSTPLVACVRL